MLLDLAFLMFSSATYYAQTNQIIYNPKEKGVNTNCLFAIEKISHTIRTYTGIFMKETGTNVRLFMTIQESKKITGQ